MSHLYLFIVSLIFVLLSEFMLPFVLLETLVVAFELALVLAAQLIHNRVYLCGLLEILFEFVMEVSCEEAEKS